MTRRDGESGRPRREYRFYTQAGEVSLEDFLAAVARRGEATVEAVGPGYKVTKRGRKALKGEVA